jgi:hypothetical protein
MIYLWVQVAVSVLQQLPHVELRVDQALVQHLTRLPQPAVERGGGQGGRQVEVRHREAGST